MRFAVKDHIGESQPFSDALSEAGHVLSADGPTDLFLTDIDTTLPGYREIIDFYRDQGAVVLLYPHGAPTSILSYDNIFDPYPSVDGQLAISSGEVELLRTLDIPRPATIVGWSFCRQFSFRATSEPRRVVFAPTHANADGNLDPGRRETNADVFRRLLEGPWEVVVRYLGGTLDAVGIWEDERVFRYVPGGWDMSTVEIDSADCVVAAAGTYPCLSLARGVPTVMYGQFALAMHGLRGEEPQPLRNLDRYRENVRYPIDVEDGPLTDAIRHACASDEPIRTWRDRWIGEPFDGPAFAKMVEAWVPKLRDAREVPITLASKEA